MGFKGVYVIGLCISALGIIDALTDPIRIRFTFGNLLLIWLGMLPGLFLQRQQCIKQITEASSLSEQIGAWNQILNSRLVPPYSFPSSWLCRFMSRLEDIEETLLKRLGLLRFRTIEFTRTAALQELSALLNQWSGFPPLSPEVVEALCKTLDSDIYALKKQEQAAFSALCLQIVQTLERGLCIEARVYLKELLSRPICLRGHGEVLREAISYCLQVLDQHADRKGESLLRCAMSPASTSLLRGSDRDNKDKLLRATERGTNEQERCELLRCENVGYAEDDSNQR
jgi:hypothetical protein